jgi:hypothetical protein
MNIFYADTHNDRIDVMNVTEFLWRFNSEQLDDTSCSAFLSEEEAQNFLDNVRC